MIFCQDFIDKFYRIFLSFEVISAGIFFCPLNHRYRKFLYTRIFFERI